MFSKKNIFIVLSLAILFSFGYFSKTNAEIITSTLTDTYTINLSGSELNNINGLNIKIKLPRKQADITTGVTFKANGANILLSTVTGPTNEEYIVSLVLTGMITDGKATITGKFIDNSIITGAEFLITSITQDGGADLTNLLTKEIIFSKSAAAPTPTPITTATPSPSPSNTDTPTPTPSVSVEVQELLDIFEDQENSLDIDPSEIQEALANKEKAKAKLSASSTVQLKKNGLNKIFFRLNGSLGKGYIDDSKDDKIFCDLVVLNKQTGTDNDFLKITNPFFTASIPRGNERTVHRFSKRGAISVLPSDGTGLKLLNGEIESIEVEMLPICYTYINRFGQKELEKYAEEKGKLVSSLSPTEHLEALIREANILLAEPRTVKLLSPKEANIGE